MGNLLWEGINLMIVGMGAVFVFLMLLVFATSIMSVMVAKIFPEPSIPKVTLLTSNLPTPETVDTHTLAAIAAAVHRHRSRQK